MRKARIRMALAIMSGRKSPDSFDWDDLQFLGYSYQELKTDFPTSRAIQIMAEDIVMNKIEFLEDKLLELMAE